MFERPSPEYDEGEGLYFEVDDELHSCFGGVLELVVQDKQLVIALTGKAARQTQLGATFSLALEMTDAQCATLVADLEKVCDGLCRVRRRS
jgi:hypothetical protein